MMTELHINYDKMPCKGYVFACYRTEVIFQKYDGIEELKELLIKTSELLELHAFDEKREYRLIRKQTGAYMETIIEDTSDKDAATEKIEYVKIEKKYEDVLKVLKVINYIEYDENGMIGINNYRLAPGKKEEAV